VAHPTTLDLLDYIEASPSPYHCVVESERRLIEAGWTRVQEGDAQWDLSPGTKAYVIRGGSIVAWRMGAEATTTSGFRLLGAHTDSPNFRIKPLPDVTRHGSALLGLEVYGGVMLGTWTDRDLGMAGRVTLRGEGGASGGNHALGMETALLRVDRPLCRIPQLAIHLNRGVNKDGLTLNPQDHLPALWGLAPKGIPTGEKPSEGGEVGRFKAFIAGELNVDPDRILGWDIGLHVVHPPTVSGLDDAFIHAPRLDNQASCHHALAALIRSSDPLPDGTAVAALYDHEEVGSRSAAGASGSFVRDVVTRLAGGDRTSLVRSMSHSVQASIDMAHAAHPNYGKMHDPQHKPVLGGGPVIKTHSSMRYATEAWSAGLMRGLAADIGVATQEFVVRTDLACGSTIGPIVAASLGIRTVDLGNPMLSMHSAREMANADDPEPMVRLLSTFLRWI
jgi:aspartyl aminopeptidase